MTWLQAAAARERLDADGIGVSDGNVAGADSLRLLRERPDERRARYSHSGREQHITEVHLSHNPNHNQRQIICTQCHASVDVTGRVLKFSLS